MPRAEKTTLRRHSWNAYVVDTEDLAVPVARISPTSRPRPILGDIAGAPLDPREAYVLALVDGKVTASDIADMTGMPEKAVLEILQKLIALQLATLA